MNASGDPFGRVARDRSSRPAAVVFDRHTVWATWAAIYLVLAAASLMLMSTDERLLQGVSVWSKPFKFQLSLAVYFITLAWFAPLLGPGYFETWRGRLMTWVAVFWAATEVGYITFQGAIGEHSHFNSTTPLHSLAYSLMGLGAVTLVSVCLWMSLEIVLRTSGSPRGPYVWAVIAGLLVTFALGGGFGGYLSSQAGHWVGAPATDAGGVWLFGWTRQGGDLRVAHFFGMHAMQLLPLFGWALQRRLTRAAALGALGIGAVGYAVVTTLVFLQAIDGRPLIG